ncbi:MAG: dihydroorotate dehydrogenase (quinone) [Methanobacteriota archaeon]|nr:MAG: dihydroorotate dehydrogenase (quinone) [Euryarchaeota archaeon]HIE63977.1 quinone-dependent dihydroorotate dehydrogenase [Candidatus Poseidoniales archaeon]
MGLAYRTFVRPMFRYMDSEKAHQRSLNFLSGFGQNPAGQKVISSVYHAPELPIHVFGKLFHHPLGLAAGFDKKAQALTAWPALGFSWMEYGGITRYPQDGNPKPRMFRADSEQALVNRMGLNNPGALAIRDSLNQRKARGKWPNTPVVANIGRSKKVTNDNAADDFSSSLELLWDYADMFVLNVSSPNTPGLRDLQRGDSLAKVINSCSNVREKMGDNKPLILKFSPDESDEDLISSAEIALSNGINGFVATNTTISRPVPNNSRSRSAFAESGGLSGRPINKRALEVVNLLYDSTGGSVPIVGVGGIDSADVAWEMVQSGASLLQLYSALIFKGPSVVSEIVKGLKKKVKTEGFVNIEEAVGYNHH